MTNYPAVSLGGIMKKLHFTYNMQIEYSTLVSNCNYTIKCIPVNTDRQKIDNLKISMQPQNDYGWSRDGFKNTYIWGKNTEPHLSFSFSIEGDAETGLTRHENSVDGDLDMIFLYPHGLNVPGRAIKAFYEENIKGITGDTQYIAGKISGLLHSEMTYQRGVTNVNTTAEEAFANRCGVCQDYAHILTALLQLSGICARYVTGLIMGEGESHAWVEYRDGDKWYGIDPTNNKPVGDEYIKIGSGRDARDCMLNRGIMHGGGAHTQVVTASVKEK